jgi:hypothetical protein
MAIRRACSYEATIKTPVDPAEYSAILVTFSQGGNNLVNKEIGDAGLTLNEDSVVVQLSQEETLLFQAATPAFLQIRCYKATYDAPGSKVWTIDVYDSLNTEVLP